MQQSWIMFWLSFVIIFMHYYNLFIVQSIQCGHLQQLIIFKYQTLLIKSMTDIHRNLLLRAYECKIKTKLNIQQFLDILNADTRLNKISEKGLFILYLCQMLLKLYIAQGVKIRNFILEFNKKDPKKRQRRKGGGQRRRRTNKNQKKRGDGKTLQQLSNQSLSNPSNVQRPRINVENRPEQSANQVPTSKQKQDDSNGGSKDSSKNALKAQLNKITQQIRGQEQTFITDVDFAPATQFQDNSQTTSSQNTSEISNLSQKIKIFTGAKQSERKITTTRRKTNNNSSRQTRTKKKRYDIIDQSIFIDETRATDQQNTIIYTQVSRFNIQQITDLDLEYNFNFNVGKQEVRIISEVLIKENIDIFKNAIHIPQPEYTPHNYDMNTNNDDIQFPDYTMSQPISVPFYQPEFFKQSLQIKQSQFDFQDLLSHSTKDKATLFYQLLWRQQNDEIELSQSEPQKFSTIKIKHK